MYCRGPVARSPSAVRLVRPASKCGRQASFLSHPFAGGRSFGPAFGAGNDFAPFFRLFDDLTGPSAPHSRHHAAPGVFQPRFDVREVDEAYELRGELPGVEGKDIEVEFSDPQTLIVRGRTERETTSGTPPQEAVATPAVEGTTETKAVADDNSDAASDYSTGSYQKASVEDEDAQGQATPAESETQAEQTPVAESEKPQQQQEVQQQQQQPTSRYWISERSTGSFQRVFSFEARVDQDAVTANLKNGVLSIVVPKAPAPAAKKITIE